MLFLDKYCLAIIQYAVIVIKIIRIGLLVEKRRQVGCESDHSSRTRHREPKVEFIITKLLRLEFRLTERVVGKKGVALRLISIFVWNGLTKVIWSQAKKVRLRDVRNYFFDALC